MKIKINRKMIVRKIKHMIDHNKDKRTIEAELVGKVNEKSGKF